MRIAASDPVASIVIANIFERHRRTAVETMRAHRVAVNLDDAIGWQSGALMKPVDVLRDDGRGAAPPAISRDQSAMPFVGLCASEVLVHAEAPPPFLQPRLLRGDEVLVGDRLDARGPKPPGARGNPECPIPSRCPRRSARRSAPSAAIRPRSASNFVVAFSVARHILPPANKGAPHAIFAHDGPRHRYRPVARFLREQARHERSSPARRTRAAATR